MSAFFSIIKNKIFDSEDNRTANVMRNSIASAGFKAASLACSLMMVPVTINYLNTENYGIWMAMTSILYWFSFFDIGLGNGLRNYLAEDFASNNYDRARSDLFTAMIVLSFVSVIIGCVAIPIIHSCDLVFLFNAHHLTNHYLALVLGVAVLFSLMQIVVKNIGIVYIAMQKYAINDLITFIGSASSLLVVFMITRMTTANLMYVVSVLTGLPVLVFVLAAIPLYKRYPQLRPSKGDMDFSLAKKIITKGLGFFFIQITSCLVIFGSANVFISHYCGPEQVTVYNISYKIFNVLTIAYTIMISPLWNAYTDAAVKGDFEWIRKIFKKSLLFWVLIVMGGILILIMSGWLIDIWIGDSVKVPFNVSVCVLIYVCAFNLNNCVTYLLNGLNRIRVQIVTSLFVTILYLFAVVFIKGKYGIVGISLSMAVSYLLMASVHLYQCCLLSNNKAKGIWNK